MTDPLEISANLANAASVVLAGLNRIHTWWVGIVGCLLFAWLFYRSQLYADTTLQAFFVVTSVIGWRQWAGTGPRPAPDIHHASPRGILVRAVGGILVASAYGWLLHRFTDAYSPFADSLVLVFSVIAQLLLMRRCYEAWWGWLIVNSIAVPLFLSRGLHVTALLYSAFWINAVVALVRWRKLMEVARS